MFNETPALFITCSTALEPLLQAELEEFGISSQPSFRGVFVNEWDWKTIYTINYRSRLATRVLLPLTRFKCFDQHQLYGNAKAIDWSQFFTSNQTLAIDANVHHHELRNSLFAAQIVKDAICDQLRQKSGRRPSVDTQNPAIQLNLYIQNNIAHLSFDTSGAPLHKRGYRQESVEAPLQETLAAALLRLANYQKEAILFDPCCGSGTILIEAALMATQTAPGYLRQKWGFMHHPQFSQEEWLKMRQEIDKKRIPLEPGHIYGIDLSREAARVSKVNLKAAGFQKSIEIQQADFRDFVPSKLPNLFITNPPYGKRMEDEARLGPLYRELGSFMKKHSEKPARGFILTGNFEAAKELGLAVDRRHILNNGGIEARLLEFEIF